MAEPVVTYRLDAVDLGPQDPGPYTIEERNGDGTAHVPVSGPSADAKPIPMFSLRDIGLR
ncbi:hypothetical protein [Agromyces sp. CCNWLW203]|uniref:hypothetical protein n=1 Tax=Agromyces sp. CCNWLW203 TaxID=3112842 RepID=UPI002F962DBD